jgi:hypothetical protein
MDFFLWGFVKDNVYVPPPPAADNTTRAQDTGQKGLCKNDQEILHNVWQEVEYRFDVARDTRGAHIELY